MSDNLLVARIQLAFYGTLTLGLWIGAFNLLATKVPLWFLIPITIFASCFSIGAIIKAISLKDEFDKCEPCKPIIYKPEIDETKLSLSKNLDTNWWNRLLKLTIKK